MDRPSANMGFSRRGAAAVSFILCLPIFLVIVAIIVQLGLIVTAKIMVGHAADAAARAAVTSLPDQRPDNVIRAARLALVPLCPKSPQDASAEAAEVYDALVRVGAEVPESLPARYTYAQEATEVTWSPRADFRRSAGRELEVTVTYRFQLTVPAAMRFVRASTDGVAGVSGRFWVVSATRTVQSAHGRAASSDGWGWAR